MTKVKEGTMNRVHVEINGRNVLTERKVKTKYLTYVFVTRILACVACVQLNKINLFYGFMVTW